MAEKTDFFQNFLFFQKIINIWAFVPKYSFLSILLGTLPEIASDVGIFKDFYLGTIKKCHNRSEISTFAKFLFFPKFYEYMVVLTILITFVNSTWQFFKMTHLNSLFMVFSIFCSFDQSRVRRIQTTQNSKYIGGLL